MSRRAPFAGAVLDQVTRLGGVWHEVPENASLLARASAVSFPKRLVSSEQAFGLTPEALGLATVEELKALDAALPEVRATDALPCGVRWACDQWLGPAGACWVDLATEPGAELDRIREELGDPSARRVVIVTWSDAWPSHHFVSETDPRPDDPAIWSTDHEALFDEIEPEAGRLSEWLAQRLTDDELFARLQG